MKIVDVKLQIVEVPLKEPFHSTWNPSNPETKLFVTLVEVITDDGIHGYGAACDSSQLLAGIWDTHIRPCCSAGRSARWRPSIPDWSTPLCTPTGHGVSRVAVWDALGKYARLPIYKMLGGVKDKVLAYASTGELKSPEERIKDAERFISEGLPDDEAASAP